MYHFKRITTVLIYLTCIIYNGWFYLAPVIATHGLLKILFVFVATTLITALCTLIFLTTKKPQATPKSPSWADPNDYQDYLNTISPTGDIND